MKRVLTILILFMVIAGISFASGAGESGKSKFITIGTGGVTGVYYPVGGAISRLVNKSTEMHSIRATVQSTGGSVFNINAVLAGDLDFGVAQSDRQYQAYNGKAEWESLGAQKELRSVFSMHPESVTLVAAVDSKIKSIRDLKGKRVNIGNIGSGTLQNSREVLMAFGVAEDSLKAEFIKPAEAPGLLQDSRIDAFFYTVGHPSGAIKEASSGRRKVILVNIMGPEVEKLIQEQPFYAISTIPQSFYPQAKNTSDTRSVGVKATLVSSTKVPEEIVYQVTKAVFENFSEFIALHPALSVLKGPEDLLAGLSAPLHKGALRYYDEAGIKVPDMLR